MQVLTERVWDLIDSDYVSSKCGMGAEPLLHSATKLQLAFGSLKRAACLEDFDCPRRNRQRNCDDLEGLAMLCICRL